MSADRDLIVEAAAPWAPRPMYHRGRRLALKLLGLDGIKDRQALFAAWDAFWLRHGADAELVDAVRRLLFGRPPLPETPEDVELPTIFLSLAPRRIPACYKTPWPRGSEPPSPEGEALFRAAVAWANRLRKDRATAKARRPWLRVQTDPEDGDPPVVSAYSEAGIQFAMWKLRRKGVLAAVPLTKAELLERLGELGVDIQPATLRAWVAAGLVDKLAEGTVPHGRGRTGYYPDDAPAQAYAAHWLLRRENRKKAQGVGIALSRDELLRVKCWALAAYDVDGELARRRSPVRLSPERTTFRPFVIAHALASAFRGYPPEESPYRWLVEAYIEPVEIDGRLAWQPRRTRLPVALWVQAYVALYDRARHGWPEGFETEVFFVRDPGDGMFRLRAFRRD